jgi:hypothetical protein
LLRSSSLGRRAPRHLDVRQDLPSGAAKHAAVLCDGTAGSRSGCATRLPGLSRDCGHPTKGRV